MKRPSYRCETCRSWFVLAMVTEVRPATWMCVMCVRDRDAVRDGHAARTSTRALPPGVRERVAAFRRLRGVA